MRSAPSIEFVHPNVGALGFTLVEVVISIAILLASFTILINLQGSAVNRAIRDRNELTALLLGRALLAGVEADVLSVEDGRRTAPASTFAAELALQEEAVGAADLSRFAVTWDVVPVDMPTQADAISRIQLTVSWGDSPADQLDLVYFAPREDEPLP